MKKNSNLKIIVLCLVLFVIGIVIGFLITKNDDSIFKTYPFDLSASGSHTHSKLEVSPQDAPLLELEFIPDSMNNGEFNVHIKVENFKFTPENVNQKHVLGEGHAHIFVDDVKIGRVYGEWYHLPKLKNGKHTVKVSLNSNDHREYSVGGKSIMKEVVVEVTEKKAMDMQSMPCHQMPDGSWMGECN